MTMTMTTVMMPMTWKGLSNSESGLTTREAMDAINMFLDILFLLYMPLKILFDSQWREIQAVLDKPKFELVEEYLRLQGRIVI